MKQQSRTERDPSAVIHRLLQATNDHDLEGLVSCFADGYVNETPVHPPRGFRGNEQVRRNWSQIFAGVPDLRARVLGTAVDGDEVWTEWEMSGTRGDGGVFLMRGVVIFCVVEATVTSARFYLEPVEETSGDIDAAISRVTGSATGAVSA
ncbi:hypothetical protein BH24ACT26_BH24ACT26_14340 [soil metagenome]